MKAWDKRLVALLALWGLLFSENLLAQITGKLNISFIPISQNDIQADAATEITTADPDIDISPLSYNYGNISVGSSSQKTFRVKNTAFGTTLTITAVEGLGPNTDQFTVDGPGGDPVPPPYNIPWFATIGVNVSFRPTSLGYKTATIRVTSNDPDESPLDVRLSGTGVAPDISASPDSRNYGNVLLGSSSSQTFTVKNDGSANLSVTGTSIVGADPGQFKIDSGGGAFTLAAGATRNISVSFRPSALGAKSASLRIVSDDPDENPFDVGLSGTGVAPDISVSPDSMDYGPLLRGASKNQIFLISNTGTANLAVTLTSLTGTDPGQFTIDSGGGAFTLAPGATRELVVRFGPVSLGVQSASLRITSNDPDENPFQIPLRGTGVEPDISVTPDSINFGNVSKDSIAVRYVLIKNIGTADLSITALNLICADSARFSIDTGSAPFTLAPADSQEITIRFRPSELGYLKTILQIVSNDLDENPYEITVSGVCAEPDIAVSPDSVNYGNVLHDSTAMQIITVFNRGNADLIVSSTLVGSDSLQFSLDNNASAFTLAPADSHKITISFYPRALGDKNAVLQIKSNDPDTKQFDIALHGTGVRPDILVSPLAYDYGAMLTKSKSTQMFTVSNPGTADLIISLISLTGPDTSQFKITAGDSVLTLAPGASHKVTVDFQPTTPGEKSADLQVHHNVVERNPLHVPLSGMGVEPDITVLPDTVNFGAVFNDSTLLQTIVIRNEGTADLFVTLATVFGADSLYFIIDKSSAPFTLTPDSSREMSICFRPQGLGDKNAILRIASNDPDENLVDIHLYGTSGENQAPYLVYYYPADSAQAIPKNAPIQFKLKDDGSGIDPAFLDVQVAGSLIVKNGMDQTNGDVSLQAHSKQISMVYAPHGSYPLDSVSVEITCRDLAMPANVLNVNFSFQVDTATVSITHTKAMGPDGGEFLDPITGLHLSVPPKVLPDTVQLMVGQVLAPPPLPEGANGIGPVYYLAPDGLQFADSVVIDLPYQADKLADYGVDHPLDLWIYHYSTIKGTWQRIAPRTADEKCVRIKTASFCHFQLATTVEQIMDSLLINGPDNGFAELPVEFSVNRARTNYGHWLEYRFDWGDGSLSAWSADTLAVHTWSKTGSYQIHVQGRCPIDTMLVLDANSIKIEIAAPSSVAGQPTAGPLPIDWDLQQNYPNPFNPTTFIRFQMPDKAHVCIEIYNLLGKKVKTLLDEQRPAGYHQIAWHADDASAQKLASGEYLCRMKTAKYEKYIKLLLIR